MLIRRQQTTEELTPGTKLKGGFVEITENDRTSRNGYNYKGRLRDGRSVMVKEFFLRDISHRVKGKVIPKNPAMQGLLKGLIKTFIRDAGFLATLDSPYLAKTLAVIEDNNTAYMVCETPEGESLERRMASTGFVATPNLLTQTADNIARALIEIHGFGMLHRDVEPANIFVRQDGSAVLMPDFGTFRSDRSTSSRIVSSMVQVSLKYAPYEIAFEDENQGEGSDIYALGAVLYHLITGAPPAPCLDRITAIAEETPDPYQPLADRVLGFDARLLRTIDLALEVFIDARIKSAGEFLTIVSQDLDLRTLRVTTADVAKRSNDYQNRNLFRRVQNFLRRRKR